MPVNTPRTWRFGVFELDASSGALRRNGAVVKLREQPARILLLLSRCTALTLFGNQITPLRARFGHAPSYLTTVLPHPAPGKMRSHSAHEKAFSFLRLNRKMGDPEVQVLRVFPAGGHYFTPVRRAATVSVWGSCASWMRACFSSLDLGISTFMDTSLQSTSWRKYWLPYFVKMSLPTPVDGSAG
jgi:hypothetical protein